MFRRFVAAAALTGSMVSMPVLAQSAPAPSVSRGALLYSMHCIGCHNTQVHWRDARVARDWARLKAEVRRWQAADRLAWSEEDITEVARHLNALYYRHVEPQARWTAPGDRVARGRL